MMSVPVTRERGSVKMSFPETLRRDIDELRAQLQCVREGADSSMAAELIVIEVMLTRLSDAA